MPLRLFYCCTVSFSNVDSCSLERGGKGERGGGSCSLKLGGEKPHTLAAKVSAANEAISCPGNSVGRLADL